MKIKQKIISGIFGITAMFGMAVTPLLVSTTPVAAADQQCSILPAEICNPKPKSDKVQDSGVFILLIWVLNILIAGVGIVAVGGIVLQALRYTTAADNQSQVADAKQKIFQIVIGLVLFGLMFVLINYLIPGGLFT